MPVQTFPHPFNLPLQGIVNAAGDLEIKFGPQYNEKWSVQQVSLEMRTAPAGATVELRYMNSFVAASGSARRASAGGDPPVFLNGGEFMTVNWENCTTGDIGRILVVYTKETY